MSAQEKAVAPGPKRLLAIDGGGIRGVLALEILGRIESLLGQGKTGFRLSDYFDYIAGTSTGAIIAAGLSIGMSVADIMDFYEKSGAQMFKRAWFRQFWYKYEDEPLAAKLRETFGVDTRLGSDELRTLLLIILRNTSTDSPWPVSNNPFAKYNARDRDDRNLDMPLWQLVRASTAAPTYFRPERITVGTKQYDFVDGGVTTYNDPAFQMFLMATVDRYWVKAPPEVKPWQTGPDRMLVVSVGTGTSPAVLRTLRRRERSLLFNARTIPSALMFAALTEQDFLCRAIGACRAGDPLDREVGDMIGSSGRPRPSCSPTYATTPS